MENLSDPIKKISAVIVKCSNHCGVSTERREENLADFVRRVAYEKGLSFREVARRGGLSGPAISDIVSGKTKQVKASTISAIAKGLGVAEEEVFAVYRGKPLNEAEAFTGEFAVLFKGFHDLSPEDQAEMMAMVRMLATEVERRRPRKPAGGKGKNGRK